MMSNNNEEFYDDQPVEYITGHIPKIKRMLRDSIDNMKTLHYMCEENISLLEQLQEEVDKL